jgi:hypothetical protein
VRFPPNLGPLNGGPLSFTGSALAFTRLAQRCLHANSSTITFAQYVMTVTVTLLVLAKITHNQIGQVRARDDPRRLP